MDQSCQEEAERLRQARFPNESDERRTAYVNGFAADIQVYQIEVKENPVTFDIDVLEWWKESPPEFSRVKDVARAYLCIPATSTSSERSFSRAGLIKTKRRTQLSSKMLTDLHFIATNIDLLKSLTRSEWISILQQPVEIVE